MGEGQTRLELHEAGGNTAYIARICHEANRAYCISIGEENVAPPWEQFSPELQRGVIQGVKLFIDNPDLTLERQHEAWRENKLAGGWVHGDAKDFDKKTHPCLVPYDQLPESQKAKDRIFQAIVRAAHIQRPKPPQAEGFVYEDGSRVSRTDQTVKIPRGL